ncbi:MAG: hypothetical protein IKN08_04020 [Bacteroidales bacterium]|nr:hypothetical protein [Bacteroidales bacterium]MBR6930149.1 hypothetical protein [Bacteroidales bacterium]
MKKSILFMACCIGLLLLAGCKKKVAPTITVFQGEGYLTENAQVYANENVKLGFVATGEKLVELETIITKDGILISRSTESIEGQPSSYTSSTNISFIDTGTMTVMATVTDANGLTASTSYNFDCIEKPYEKFLGNYEGNALFSGNMEVNMDGVDPMQQEVTEHEVPVSVVISGGPAVDEVIILLQMDNQEMELAGKVDGNMITCEADHVSYSFNYDLGGGFNVTPEMDVSYIVKATLDGNQLMIDGTCTGSGEVHVLIYNGTISVDGIIGGSLNKLP